MRLPNFLIIGSQKAATTTLHGTLRRHPGVFLPPRKELHFFSHPKNYRRGLDWYASHFRPASGGVTAVGEASPEYVCHPDAPERIARTLPDVRLVLTVRDPVDRAYSQYWDKRRRLIEPLGFEETVEVALEKEYRPGRRGYFSRGMYIRYIRRYLEIFDRAQLMVVPLQDLVRRPGRTYRRIAAFLGVDEAWEPPVLWRRRNRPTIPRHFAYRWCFEHRRVTRYLPGKLKSLLRMGPRRPFTYPPMSPETRSRLEAFYAPFNAELETFLGRSLGWMERG